MPDGAPTIEFADSELGFVELAKPEIRLPAFDWTDPLFHVYEHIGVVSRGPVDAARMWEAFKRQPGPGADGEPVVTGSGTDIDVDFFGIDVIDGRVTHTVYDEGLTIINKTKDDHTLHDGAVQRTLIITDQGAFVYTVGVGVNSSPWTQFLN